MEVDIVIERGTLAIAGVDVKAAATVTVADFRGLRKLKNATGKRCAGGVVLYIGETTVRFSEGRYAVPIRALWGRVYLSELVARQHGPQRRSPHVAMHGT